MDDEKRHKGLSDEEKAHRASWVQLARQASSRIEEAVTAPKLEDRLQKLSQALLLLRAAEALVKHGKKEIAHE